MKVTYVLTTDEAGIPHYTAELANGVSSKGVDVSVLKPAETTADGLFSSEINVVDAFAPLDVSMVKIQRGEISPLKVIQGTATYRNLSMIHDINPDIVHFTDNPRFNESPFSLLEKIYENYPIVRTYHDIVPQTLPNPFQKPISFQTVIGSMALAANNLVNRAMFQRWEDKMIVHTNRNRDRLVAKNAPEDKIHVVPHGAYQFFTNYDHGSIETESNTVLFFGRIVPESGLDTAVSAIESAKSEIPDIKLLITGDGSIPQESQEIIKENPDHFEVVNEFIPNEEVGTYFSRTSIVLVPYRHLEGHSGTVTIAFSFGKPLITTDVSEFPTLIEGSGAGRCVPRESADALADALVSLLSDEDLRNQMADRSSQMAESLSWDTIAERHLEIYNDLL